MITDIITDIEGTTTPLSYVKDVLFPHSARALPSFLAAHEHDPVVQSWLAQLPAHTPALQQLSDWIKADAKEPVLKAIQGMIWREAYVKGEFVAEVYPDVPSTLIRWRQAGLRLHVYSSGSEEAQILLFKHTAEGDLSRNFTRFFDTRWGGKKHAEAYIRIAGELAQHPSRLLFLSDIEAELDAAAEAGWRTLQLLRPGTPPSTRHPTATRFDNILVP